MTNIAHRRRAVDPSLDLLQDYYLSEGEATGEGIGTGPLALGLHGTVDGEPLHREWNTAGVGLSARRRWARLEACQLESRERDLPRRLERELVEEELTRRASMQRYASSEIARDVERARHARRPTPVAAPERDGQHT